MAACVDDTSLELLTAARNNEVEIVCRLLSLPIDDGRPNINCKGKNKSNLGWSPLHLAAYFGHKDVVQLLLEKGADVNITNNIGDTPLQRAAHTGRLEVVLLLLQFNAATSIKNAEGRTAQSLARNPEVIRVIEGAETAGLKRAEQDFIKAARDGETDSLVAMLKPPTTVSINCTDSFGNTALHLAAYRGQEEVVVLLLQNGIDTTKCNDKGQRAVEMTRTVQMKQVLDVKPVRELQRGAQHYEGALYRKSKLLGYRHLWVVLERGVLSFFKNRADASTGARRKNFKYLDGASVENKANEAHIFSVSLSDGTSITLAVESNATAGIQRQKWQNALNDHIACANYYTKRDTDTDDEDMKDIVPLGSMGDALQSATAHQQLLEKQVRVANTAISTIIESNADTTSKQVSLLQVRLQLAQIGETTQEMVTALSHCLTLLTQQEELRKLQLAQEVEKSRVLQEALHVLAEEHHHLEQSLGGHRSPTAMIDSDNEEEFYDCNNEEINTNGSSNKYPRQYDRSGSDSSGSDSGGSETEFEAAQDDPVSPVEDIENGHTSHSGDEATAALPTSLLPTSLLPSGKRIACPIFGRTRLPVPCFSRNDFSIWSILKQCIGKELSKITMPVIFNEPLSFLQRIVEYMEYAKLLQKANDCDDPVQRLEYVTAFAVSATASNWERIGKPFNPLLGETYELVREDLGFRIVSEQVSHHPPVSAFHAESADYAFHGAIHPKLKFWGKSVEVTPKGIVSVELRRHGEVYTWQNVNCCVHNIIVGKLWIELYGAMEVLNHKTKHKAVLNFKSSGWFGKDLHKIEGFIYDAVKKKQRAIYGKWVEGLYSYDIDVWEAYNRSGGREHIAEGEVPGKGSTCNLNLPNQRCLWLAHERPEDSAMYYNFSLFAMMLNEVTDATRESVPSTDCRLRPDLRTLEEGDIDGAGAEKHRLEEKQRTARKERKKRKEEWTPRWFYLETNPYTGKEDWIFKKEYWEHKYEGCPDIF